jgi:hypothetical protein
MTIRNAPRPARYATLCLLALLAALCHAHEARAQWTTSGTNTTTTNNVGVGTAAPQTSLHVSTAASGNRGIINEQTSADANSALLFFRKSRAGAAAQNGDNIGSLFASAFDGASFVNGARLRFAIDGPVTAGSVPTTIQFLTGTGADGLERMRISSAGNVGIGTTTPTTAKLVISGTAGLTGLDLSSTDQYAEMRVIRNSLNPGDKDLYLQWMAGAGSKTHFYSDNAETMTINAGNVGIGTVAPASKLHVAGNITVDGNINAKYQDVAEWVPSAQKLAAGTVVILDAARDNHVTASMKAYDTRVAGVVSAQPGISLGEAGEGKALIATTGRVKVKVDASRGAIRVGDILVTSGVPGVAMRSKPVSVGGVSMHRPGTIIGKALESLAGGTGEILVLLSLQ